MVRRRTFFIGLILLYCSGFTTNVNSQSPQILNFAIGEYPPGVSEFLPQYGFFTEIVTEAFAAEGIEVHYRFYPWSRVWLNVSSGRSDGSLAYFRTPEREKLVLFSDPFWDMSYSAAFCLKEKNFSINEPEDLLGYRIIVQRAYSYGANVDAYLASGEIDPIYIDSEEQAFRMLKLGRADFFLTNNLNGLFTLKTYFPQEEIFEYFSYDPILAGAWFHMIISKKHPQGREIIEKFNSGLEKIKGSGLYDQISADYQP